MEEWEGMGRFDEIFSYRFSIWMSDVFHGFLWWASMTEVKRNDVILISFCMCVGFENDS